MKKDIEIPKVENVYVAVAHEWNEEFQGKDWNAYIINDREDTIETVLIVSKGYDGETKTATFRHVIQALEPKSYGKIELMQEDVLRLNNEFYVTFFAEGKMFEKKFIFRKNTINERAMQNLPVLEIDGVLCK
ncbi:hypothetical protein SAMN05216480_10975 [Pustulibacterium marinum]|uniref:Phenylalanyl-tRNA synthetase subunit alpha n=1 Tax=Pustulibacterium marinum TaxID=1224947 RepID=A0A1I7HHD6_9FLAO|nr:hypothetical protein [Pustulibacterium marinum]SFU60150.1 hypothetical protein SAMN05216480_10975 [Pustulibacterium marinum]